MDSIIIPTRPILNTVRGQKYHLLLSHELTAETIKFYRDEHENGSYLILDNSAHEKNEGEDLTVLLDQARQLNANEIVVPDVLFNYPETIYRMRTGLTRLKRLWEESKTGFGVPRLMVVPQGATPKDYLDCLWEMTMFIPTMPREWQWTLGISKDYNDYFPDEDSFLLGFLRDEAIPAAKSFNGEIHLLGWPKPLPVMSDIAKHFYWNIRSTDSARPVTFTMFGIDLRKSLDVEYPKRPSGFFDLDVPDRRLLYQNVWAYRRLCRTGDQNQIGG